MDENTHTTPTNGGRITDEVRRDIDVCTQSGATFDTVFIVKSALLCDLDRIDKAHKEALQREHETAYEEGYDAGFASADDWCAQHEDAMAEHGWVRLPKDADGEYIHVGDVMEDADGEVFTVSSIDYGFHLPNRESAAWMLWSIDAEFNEPADQCRHHHEPTVEDVLTEFARECLTYATCVEDHEVTDAIELYAPKLRLAGDAE